MLDTIVRYLHESLLPFRLSSYPSMEHLPKAAQPIPKYALLVDSQLVLVADKLTILCFGASDHVDLSALANDLAAQVIDAEQDDLPEALKRYEAAPPPLGQLFGLPIIVDEKVPQYASIVFQPFGESDYVEIPYDDFARQEQPRVSSFARAGELGAYAKEQPTAPPLG
jgi:prolyl-tRNA editing enzyme YbaK/EbsC (Cys-tRNA(Pro) deacylase)